MQIVRQLRVRATLRQHGRLRRLFPWDPPEPRRSCLAAPAAEIMRISAHSTIHTALTLSGDRASCPAGPPTLEHARGDADVRLLRLILTKQKGLRRRVAARQPPHRNR